MLAQQMSQQTPAGLAAGLPDGRLKTMNASHLAEQLGVIASHGGDQNDSFTNDVQELFSLGVLPKSYLYQVPCTEPLEQQDVKPVMTNDIAI
jgi:hypothetical protein